MPSAIMQKAFCVFLVTLTATSHAQLLAQSHASSISLRCISLCGCRHTRLKIKAPRRNHKCFLRGTSIFYPSLARSLFKLAKQKLILYNFVWVFWSWLALIVLVCPVSMVYPDWCYQFVIMEVLSKFSYFYICA